MLSVEGVVIDMLNVSGFVSAVFVQALAIVVSTSLGVRLTYGYFTLGH